MSSPSLASDSYTSFTSFTERHAAPNHLFSADVASDTSERGVILKDLEDSISLDEHNAQYLLKAFDISLDDRSARMPGDDSFASHFPEVLLESPTSTRSRHVELDCEHRPENPFLSTPLRLKHFSRLSPTTLRGLLRSPSVRSLSPDFSEELPSDYFLDAALDHASESPVASVFPKRDLFAGPMTPPMTGKIPDCAQLPSARVDLPAVAELKPSPSDPEAFISPLPSPPHDNEAQRASVYHLMPAATIEQFRRVIDELSLSSGQSLIERRQAPPLPQVQTLTPPRASIAKKPAGFLEVEFATLLLERAENEEAEAEKLAQMAKRLRNLAECRRTLAHLMQDSD